MRIVAGRTPPPPEPLAWAAILLEAVGIAVIAVFAGASARVAFLVAAALWSLAGALAITSVTVEARVRAARTRASWSHEGGWHESLAEALGHLAARFSLTLFLVALAVAALLLSGMHSE
jgi:hypothetical protein